MSIYPSYILVTTHLPIRSYAILTTALAPFSSLSSHLIPHCVVKLLNLIDWLFSIKTAVIHKANRRTR